MQEYQKWFREASFGMFIHWGLYSLLGRGEWVRYNEDIPADEYHRLADRFNPRNYDPRKWARLAREAGMKYMVLTTKHHDGFCLFDSKYTDFTAPKTACGRDLVREYVDACRAEGLKVGLYFSVKDWEFPEYFVGPEADPEGFERMVTHFHNQTLELMTNYGKIDILWFDCDDDPNFRGGYPNAAELFRSYELEEKIRALQPGILINPRAAMHYDFTTPEGEIPIIGKDRKTLVECCMTMGGSWGYSPDNTCASVTDLIARLQKCAVNGYNLLLNVGPDPDGNIPADQEAGLRAMGEWLRVNGEAFYNTERLLPAWWDYGCIATRGNNAYLYIKKLPRDGRYITCSLANEVRSAEILETGDAISVERDGRRLILSGFPEKQPERLPFVIRLELDSPARAQFYY